MATLGTDRETGGFEEITISTTAKGFTESKLKPTTGTYAGKKCSEIFFVMNGANIRYKLNGDDPTTTEGVPMLTGQNLTLRNEKDIANFRAVRDDAVDAKLHVLYRFGR